MGGQTKIIEQIAMQQNPEVKIDKTPVENYFELEENTRRGKKTKRMRFDGSGTYDMDLFRLNL